MHNRIMKMVLANRFCIVVFFVYLAKKVEVNKNEKNTNKIGYNILEFSRFQFDDG